MDHNLWNRLLAFNLDAPMSEYGFSTRLAKENYWTKNFTARAILEYKKFMYLAGTSDLMISPSEAIDVVWHQHLTFTKSYTKFCAILGKQIQHVPSTRRKEDAEKFRAAKERTAKLYDQVFGEQPDDIWKFSGMYESLGLSKANIKVRTFVLLGILAWTVLTLPGYYLLGPLYLQMGNPDFLLYYIPLSVVCFGMLVWYNKQQAAAVIRDVHPDSFLFDLQPLEFVYLKRNEAKSVINGTLSRLLSRGMIESDGAKLRLAGKGKRRSVEEHQVLEILNETGPVLYQRLLYILELKPVFSNTRNAIEAIKKYFVKSRKFGKLFYINFGALSLLLLLGFIRLVTGILRDRPVEYITMALVAVMFATVFFLIWFTQGFVYRAVADHYNERFRQLRKTPDEWEWQYAFYGTTFLAPALITLAGQNNRSTWDSGSSSSDSSCGSSCSSCGGCGGD